MELARELSQRRLSSNGTLQWSCGDISSHTSQSHCQGGKSQAGLSSAGDEERRLALVVRQILQSALVVGGGNLRCLAANFPHRGLSLVGPALPFGHVHEVAGRRGARDPVGGGSKLRSPLPRSRNKGARLCATQRPCRAYAQSLLGLLQRLGGPFLGFSLLSILRFHACQLGIGTESLKLLEARR